MKKRYGRLAEELKIPSESIEVIERRQKMRLKDILESKPYEIVTINKSRMVSDAVSLMREKNVSGLFVVDDQNALTSVFTERDIVRCVYDNTPTSEKLENLIMRDITTFDPSTEVSSAIAIASRKKITASACCRGRYDCRNDHLQGFSVLSAPGNMFYGGHDLLTPKAEIGEGNMKEENGKKLEDIQKEAEERACPVQMMKYFMEEFIEGPMCSKCYPCSLGTAEAMIRLNRLSIHPGDAGESDRRALQRIAEQMIDASFCKKGKDTGRFILSTMVSIRGRNKATSCRHLSEKGVQRTCRIHH